MCGLGDITSPPDGTKYVFLPGRTAKIKWEFDDAISSLTLRSWSFTSSDGSLTESLASIFQNGNNNIKTRLFEVDIERPATLVLKNVNQSYNGMYQFTFVAATTFTSNVIVSIASKFSLSKHLMSLNVFGHGQTISMTESCIQLIK